MNRETFLSLNKLDRRAETFRYTFCEKKNIVGYFETELSNGQEVRICIEKRRFDYIAAAEFNDLVPTAVGSVPSAAVEKLIARLNNSLNAATR